METLYFTLARAMPNGFGFDPRDMLYKQLRKSEDLLKHDMAYFARLNPQDPDYSVEWLLGRVDYLLYEKVQDNNQEDLDRRFAKFSGEPKPPPPKSANAQGAKGEGKGRGKGKKGKGKGKHPGSTEGGPAHPKPPCFNWQRGHCDYGKDCRFSHDGPKGKSTGGAAANEAPKSKGAPKKHPQAPPPKAEPKAPKSGPQDQANGAKGKGKGKRKRSRSRSAAAAADGGSVPQRPTREVSGRLCKFAAADPKSCPSGRDCPFSHDVSLYRQWGKYNRAMAVSRGRTPSPARRTG